jgi:hypothetical protein
MEELIISGLLQRSSFLSVPCKDKNQLPGNTDSGYFLRPRKESGTYPD